MASPVSDTVAAEVSGADPPGARDVPEINVEMVAGSDGEDDVGDGGPHNRSHESISSRRTIIEADDFASFLAQDDDDDMDDFKDEDVDYEVTDDGVLNMDLLTRAGENPYMLDFTAGMMGDSEVEGEEDDDTLSDNDDGSLENGQTKSTPRQHFDPERGPNPYYKQTRSWVKHARTVHQRSGTKNEESMSDSEEFDSPPRNLREEINNNVGKFFPIGGPLGSSLINSSSDEELSPGGPLTPRTGAGIPGLSKFFIPTADELQFKIPPAPSPTFPKSQFYRSGPQPRPTSPVGFNPQTLPSAFTPPSQSSPKQLRKSLPQNHDADNFTRHPNSTATPSQRRYSYSDSQGATHQRNLYNQPAPQDNGTPQYSLHTANHSSRLSSSMENLAPSVMQQQEEYQLHDDALHDPTDHMQRVNSLPNMGNFLTGLCKNCGFSRQDYLFKIQLLQTQLEKTEKEMKKKEKQWMADIGELKKENDRQQKIISQSLNLGPEARIEATMQHEITRLTSENLDLRESIDKQTDQIRKLKKMLKVYAKKLKDGEAAEIAAELENEENTTSTDTMATVIHRERSYMGMLEYKKEDESALIKNLVLDLKPKVASGQIPGLPAYVLFMCVRHTDYINDDEKVKSLLTSSINGIKKVVKRHSDDLERITLWLANTCRLLHTLKQYSGEKQFQTENTPKQNEQSLRNFDLSEYRQVFSDLAVWNYQALMKLMEELIQPSIVPAILEHEAIAGLTASKPSGLRGRSSSNAREMDDGKDSQHALDALMRTLNSYMRIVKQHAVDPELVKQIFRQLFYFLCAGALNNLLLRKDMCNWSKGMQIRYNLSHLEQWLRDNNLHEFGALGALDPIIQASQLLQARKTDSDVDSVCDMCSKLTNAQIVKILNIYTPVDEFEERVPIAFIRKIQAKLKQREEQSTASNTTLLMDTKYSYPVTFPFNPSSVALETISVPEQLHLGFLIRH